MAVEQYLDRFQKMRKERAAFMIKELVERGGKAEMNEFMGSIATNYGIRRTPQQEYLEDLKYAGAIDVMGNSIILKCST
jgi:uncharacterized protein (DUF111 family)